MQGTESRAMSPGSHRVYNLSFNRCTQQCSLNESLSDKVHKDVTPVPGKWRKQDWAGRAHSNANLTKSLPAKQETVKHHSLTEEFYVQWKLLGPFIIGHSLAKGHPKNDVTSTQKAENTSS